MRKWIIWNVIGVIFCIVGVAIIGGTLIKEGFNVQAFSAGEIVTEEVAVEETFTGVRIKAGTEDVIFTASEDGKSHVTFQTLSSVRHLVKVEGDKLIVETEDDGKWYEKIGFWAQSPRITIALPKEELDEISVKTNTGDVEIANLSCENLQIEVNTGDVSLKRVIAKGEWRLKANTGDLEFQECDAGTAWLETVTGDVEGTFLTGKQFETSTVTGDVEVPREATGGACKIKTNTGDVYVEITQERGMEN